MATDLYRILIIFAVVLFLVGTKTTQAMDYVILQKDKHFSKDTLTVKLGDTIIFKNEETEVNHNVYSLTPKNEFELKVLKPGETDSVHLVKPSHALGKMLIECAVHPNMKLWVTIKK